MNDMTSPAPARPPIRIGHDERNAAIHALDDHLSAGRLDADEYGERMATASLARNRTELEELFLDLPHPNPFPRYAPQQYPTPQRAMSGGYPAQTVPAPPPPGGRFGYDAPGYGHSHPGQFNRRPGAMPPSSRRSVPRTAAFVGALIAAVVVMIATASTWLIFVAIALISNLTRGSSSCRRRGNGPFGWGPHSWRG